MNASRSKARFSGRVKPNYRRGFLDNSESKCIGFGGSSLDEAVMGQVFDLLQPGAVEAVTQAVAAKQREQDDLLTALRLDLQAARYDADRAQPNDCSNGCTLPGCLWSR
ncbi:MAG: hypothetical protein WD768_08670 [Phycisphaeraceae bacterium]